MALHRIETLAGVRDVVDLILEPNRARPIAVVSTRNRELEPPLDVGVLHEAVGWLGDVYVVVTGPFTYRMQELMPVGTHVFGGASRVYPPSTSWHHDPYSIPLRLVHGAEEAVRAIRALTRDMEACGYGTASWDAPAPAPVDDGARVADLERKLVTERETHSERLKVERAKTTKGDGTDVPPVDLDLFTDPDEAVRWAILTTWVDRIPASDKAGMPLSEYTIGPEFTATLMAFEDARIRKALRCAVDVLCDIAKTMPARELHALRSGSGAHDAPVTRADGAACWRANIESITASARRLHYWKLPGGGIELSRVVMHDDMTP